MNPSNLGKTLVAVVLLGGAGFGFFRFFSQDSGVSERQFFYDLSEKKLFAAPRDSLPPIRGLNNAEEDAVRAVVICIRGNPDNPADRTIAYLEKYAPELKLNLGQVRVGKAEPLPARARNAFRLVKRPQDADWQHVDTPEGQAILSGWSVAGPDGKFPTVCSP